MATTEEQITPATTEQEVGSIPAEEAPATEVSVEKAAVKDGKATKKAAPRKAKSPTHPPYFEMINEAITTLKEKNGSSQYAIQKFIEEREKNLPSNFRKLLLVNLRKFVASGRIVKVKGSFKLPAARSKTSVRAVTTTAKPAAKKAKASATKPKKAVVTAKPKAKPTKTRSVAAVAAKAKPVPAAKPKAKAKAAPAPAKKTVGTKRKAVVAIKPKEKPAKVAKTAVKLTPSKKAAPKAKTPVKKAVPVAKKAAVKSVKAKSVKKAPAKRAMSTRARK